MVLERILFPGCDHIDQWTKITEILGTPGPDFISRLEPPVRNYVLTRSRRVPKLFTEIFPDECFPISSSVRSIFILHMLF